MRRKKFSDRAGLVFPATFMLLLAVTAACDRGSGLADGAGFMRLAFSDSWSGGTRSIAGMPDTNDFILNVSDEDGDVIYSGPYGASPEIFEVSPGSYMISVRSSEFASPAFSMPVFGDDRCVVVPGGGTVSVELECIQVNSGVRLRIDPDFLTAYPQGVLFLSSEDGRLMYGYSEKRIAYFNPGNVSLVMNEEDRSRTLLTRWLESREILTLNIDVPEFSADGGHISITVDTSRVWTTEDYVIGEESGNSGSEPEEAVSVSQARTMAGEKDVWVTGFVVGGDLSRSSMSFEGPFESATNLAIATRSSVRDKDACMSVELPSGDVRDALNLVSNPALLGRQIWIRGDIVESYFGIPGIKSTDEFVVK